MPEFFIFCLLIVAALSGYWLVPRAWEAPLFSGQVWVAHARSNASMKAGSRRPGSLQSELVITYRVISFSPHEVIFHKFEGTWKLGEASVSQASFREILKQSKCKLLP